MCIQAMDITTIGGTDRIIIIIGAIMAGTHGVIMIGTHHIITVVITTVGLITTHIAITIMAIRITMVATMAIMAIMFTTEEDFHIVRPDEVVCHQIMLQVQPEAAMQILRLTIHPEEAVPIRPL